MAKPAAVVIGSGLNALGVVRSLAPERILITVVDEGRRGPATHSRFARTSVCGGDLVEHLLALPVRDERPVLFPTTEASVARISDGRKALDARFRILLAEPGLLAALMSKSRFESLAAAHGFAVPRSVKIEAAAEIEQAMSLEYPAVLKPLVKNEAWDRRFKKAYRLENFAALERLFDGAAGDMPAVIVQEWIEGSDSDVYFTLVYRDAEGSTCASFTGRKIRQWPPLVGGTGSCMPAPAEHDLLAAFTTRFFDVVGFVGLGSMEYKRDPRSGRFVMVEPTVGRTDYQEEVSTLNGINIVRAAYCSLAGLSPPRQGASAFPAIWVDYAGDERSRAAQPDLRIPAEAMTMPRVDALFRMNDPGPWLADLWNRAGGRLGLRRS